MKIIAGHCSYTPEAKDELLEIARMPEVWGVRCVGKKSVTSYGNRFMGCDLEKEITPKVIDEVNKLGKVAATEILSIKDLDKFSGKNMFIWNSANNQNGWFIKEMAEKAKKENWHLGIKNGKWVGDTEAVIDGVPLTNMEKTWYGHLSFAGDANTFFIQRGVDSNQKGNYRYIPSHRSVARIKKLTKKEVLFDPSHCFGEKMRDEIIIRTIEAMKLKTEDDNYLYDGLLIEVGISKTDSNQHLTLEEFKLLVGGLKFRYA